MYHFRRGFSPKVIFYTQVFCLVLRLKSELADDVRRRFLRAVGAQKLSPPAPAKGGAGAGLGGHFQKQNGGSRFAFESCAAYI